MCGTPENCECGHHSGQAHCKEECRDKPHTGQHSYGDCGCGTHPAGGCCSSDASSAEASGGSVAEGA
jgi:hypothetical protein